MEELIVNVHGDGPIDGLHHDGSEEQYKTIDGKQYRTSKGLSGKSIAFPLAEVSTMSIIELKQKIQQELGHLHGCEHQILVYKGLQLGRDEKTETLVEDRTLASYLVAGESSTIGLVLAPPRLHIRVERTGQATVIVVKPFDPSETPADVVRWYASSYPQPAGVKAPTSLRFDGMALDDGVAIGEQGVTRERMVVLAHTESDAPEGAAAGTTTTQGAAAGTAGGHS